MSKTKSLLVWVAMGLPQLVVAAPDIAIQHAEPLRAYRVAARNSDAPTSVGQPELLFNAFGQDFALELQPNARLATMQARLKLPPGTAAYRGKLTGRANSWVRIVLTPAGPTGIVFDGETLYGLEVGSDSAPAGDGNTAPEIFRLADVYVAPGTLSCAAATATDGAQFLAAMVAEFTPLAAQGATLNLDLGAVADFEFATMFGAAAETELLTRFNNVDGIFSEQLGVQISVAKVDIFTDANDPFVATEAGALLEELATYRGATPAQEALGLTHLFTGRNLDGTTAGIAYVGSVCSRHNQFDPRSFAAGLSEGRRGATIDSLVAAHEIGHNFGAPHDAEAGSACQATPATFLMAPSINGVDQFSPCSISQMQAEIASATCLTPIGTANMAVTVADQTPNVSVATPFDYTVTVTNLGAEAATGVTLVTSAESALGLFAATAVGTTCTVGTTDATCALGTIGAGSSKQVTLSLNAHSVGMFNLGATVAADENTDASDDHVTATVTVAPVVDLVVSGSTATLQSAQQGALITNLENAADFGATGVAVSATLSGGLRADQANLAGTACAIAGQTVTCPPRTLAAHAAIPLTLTLTGTVIGNQQVTVVTTANEAERAPSDNQLAISVNVTANATDELGGGGALSWVSVLALLGGYWSRRSRARTQV